MLEAHSLPGIIARERVPGRGLWLSLPQKTQFDRMIDLKVERNR